VASTTSSYLIGVKADLDATTFQSGATQAEAAMEGLATTTQTAAADIDTALATDVPASVDAAAVGLTTKSTKFKAVGTELGTTLAQGIGSGASGPEAVSGTVSSLSGLLATVATSPAGIVGAAGVGLGVALVTNLIKGMQEAADKRRAEFVGSVNSMFDSIEHHARDTAATIREDLLSAFDAETVVKELGGADGIIGGVEQLKAVSKDLGVPWESLVDIIRGNITPLNAALYKTLVAQSKEVDYQTKVGGIVTDHYTDAALRAQELLGFTRDNRHELDAAERASKGFSNYLEGSKAHASDLAGYATTIAVQMANAEAAGQGLGAAIAATARSLYRVTH
jgi:hypothetical protein